MNSIWPSDLSPFRKIGLELGSKPQISTLAGGRQIWTVDEQSPGIDRRSSTLQLFDLHDFARRSDRRGSLYEGVTSLVHVGEESIDGDLDAEESPCSDRLHWVECWGVSSSWGVQASLSCTSNENRDYEAIARAMLVFLDRPLAAPCPWNLIVGRWWEFIFGRYDPRVYLGSGPTELREIVSDTSSIPINSREDHVSLLLAASENQLDGSYVILPMSATSNGIVVAYAIALIWGGDAESLPALFLYPAVPDSENLDLVLADHTGAPRPTVQSALVSSYDARHWAGG